MMAKWKEQSRSQEVTVLRTVPVVLSHKDREIQVNANMEEGYVRHVPRSEQREERVWFLPHFPVLRPDKSTTKVRIVFDGSSQFAGTSLNDTIYQGPKLQRELSDVLLRFRKYQVCVTCDIAEMYLRIGL